MKTATLVLENNQPHVIGRFEFELSPHVSFNEQHAPVRTIQFSWCVDVPQTATGALDDEKVFQIMGEKLKQDFILFLREKSQQPA